MSIASTTAAVNGQAKSAAAKAPVDNVIDVPLSAEQDFTGQAQYARPAILRTLVRTHTFFTLCMACCTVLVVANVVREQMAGDRVWASTPEGRTYELMVHADPQAAVAYLRNHTKAALAAQQAK